MTIRLWSINRWLRWIGVALTIQHPTAPEVPTLIKLSWIGWGSRALAADDGRGLASGYVRDPERDAKYMRCVKAMDDAWTAAVAREY